MILFILLFCRLWRFHVEQTDHFFTYLHNKFKNLLVRMNRVWAIFNRIPSGIWLFAGLICMGFLYEFHEILPLEPEGRHRWRQSDCASFAWNYYHGSLNLFQPAMNNVLSSGTGQAAAEFPFIYWVVGILYRIFGPYPILFRLVNLSIVFTGLWGLHRIIRWLIQDKFWSFFIPFFLFSSPFFVYYSSGFIPDPPAVGLCLLGWYQVSRYLQTRNHRHIMLGFVLFTLASLIKITMLISVITLIGLIIFNYFFPGKAINGSEKVDTGLNYRLLLPGFLILFGAVIGWYMYASWYSTRFEYNHFTGIIRPVFSTPAPQRAKIFSAIWDQTPYFFHYTGQIILIISGFVGLMLLRKSRWHLPFIMILTSFGGLCYLGIFFRLLGGHEYYHIANIIPVSAILISGSYGLSKAFPVVSGYWLTKVILSFLVAVNLLHTRQNMKEYYNRKNPYNREKTVFYEPEFHQYLESIGITNDHYVISIPDRSPNNTLYLMKKRGWTSFNNPKHFGDPMQKWTGKFGEIFLIVSDTTLLKDSLLAPALYQHIGEYQDVNIFKLDQN